MDAQSHLRGILEDVHFPDLLLEISQRRETGILRLRRQNIEKEIFFQDGRIVFAKSNDSDQRLGELLLRRGKVTLKHLEEAASRIVPGVRLGTILVQEGYLKAGELYQGVIDQVEEIVYSVFEWTDGAYEFESGDLPGREVITLSISTPDIINIGIGRIWRWSWIRNGVGPLDTLYVRRKEWNSIARKMLVTPAMQELIELLENPMKLEEILDASRINSYETCKLVWALLSTGIIEKIPRLELPQEAETPAAEPAAAPEPPVEAPPTEVIPWEPQRLPPAPSLAMAAPVPFEPALPAAEFPAPEPDAPVVDVAAFPAVPMTLAVEPEAAPTVEISFSDFAEFTDQLPQQELPEPPAPAEPAEVPEAVIRKDISNFNELHRYMFEMLRIEMGAGVGNFLTKILKKAAEMSPLIFEGIRMNEYGELDAEALQANVQGNLVDDYAGAFEWLLSEERETAASFLDRKRIDTIEAGLQKIHDKHREAH